MCSSTGHSLLLENQGDLAFSKKLAIFKETKNTPRRLEWGLPSKYLLGKFPAAGIYNFSHCVRTYSARLAVVSIIFIFLRSYVKLAQDEIALIRPRTICLSLKLSHLPKYLLMAVDGIYNTLYAVNACLPSLGLRSRVCLPACLLPHYHHRFAPSIDSSISKSPKRK